VYTDFSVQIEVLTQNELINYCVDHFNCQPSEQMRCEEDHTDDDVSNLFFSNGGQGNDEIQKTSFLKLLYMVGEGRNKTKSHVKQVIKSDVLEATFLIMDSKVVAEFMAKLTKLNDESLSQRFLSLIKVYGWDAFKEMLLNLIVMSKRKNIVKALQLKSNDQQLKDFVLDEFSEMAENIRAEKLEIKLMSFEHSPFNYLANLLSANLKLQQNSILKCLDSYDEFLKISQFNTHRDCVFPSYFCLFEKILSQNPIRQKNLLDLFHRHFDHLNSQIELAAFLKKIITTDANKCQSIHWLQKLFDTRLDWLAQEIKLNSNGQTNWKMPNTLLDLPEPYLQFEAFLKSEKNSTCLKNMFSSIAEARTFASKYAGNKKGYSCQIEAMGLGKRAFVTVVKTKNSSNNIDFLQRDYKKEYDLIKHFSKR
jgi:hypothetical protein